MSDGIPVSGVSELVLEVLDLEAAERFYAEVLGLPVVERWPHREAIWVMAGRQTRIGLWRPQVGIAGGRGGVHVHYAMTGCSPTAPGSPTATIKKRSIFVWSERTQLSSSIRRGGFAPDGRSCAEFEGQLAPRCPTVATTL